MDSTRSILESLVAILIHIDSTDRKVARDNFSKRVGIDGIDGIEIFEKIERVEVDMRGMIETSDAGKGKMDDVLEDH